MPIKLTDVERLLLSNQCRILSLMPGNHDKEFHARSATILERGYTSNYEDALQSLRDWKELPVERCQYVLDVFNMFSAIKDALEDGVPALKSETADLEFSGFEESDLSLYAKFLIEDMGKYKWLTIPNWNLPTTWRYTPMLSAWKESARESALTEGDLQRIATAVDSARNGPS